MSDNKGIRPIGSEVPLPTDSKHLQPGKVDRDQKEFISAIGLFKDDIPIEAKNLPLEEIIETIENVLKDMVEGLGFIKRILISIGVLKAPTLSKQGKIDIIKRLANSKRYK